ncbi:MAG: NAD-dependent epimerase/dehydratase family protein [Chloroflexi bacterium]|nr:MAG: NAD-dependent epimerase/dehydratase family protein [Chloroflexota bacterium]
MTRILVTGANGHIGTNIIRSLLKRNYDVVPFVRKTSDLRGLSPLGLTYAYGDVMDENSLIAAAEGCDVIIHTAAVYKYWAKDPDEIMQPALIGTRNIFNAAKAVGTKRIVYTSSVWAMGTSGDPDVPLTTKDWNDHSENPYALAKTKSERAAWQLAETNDIPMIAICPNGVFGPYDYRPTATQETLRDLVNGLLFTFDSGVGYADVRDVAEIHAIAVTQGEPGQRYGVSGENLLLRELGALIGKLTGFTPMHIGLGRTTFAMIARLTEFAAKVTRSKPLITSALIHDLNKRYLFMDCEETWRTFDYRPISSEKMVSDAIRWLHHIGEVKPKRARQLVEGYAPDMEWDFA